MTPIPDSVMKTAREIATAIQDYEKWPTHADFKAEPYPQSEINIIAALIAPALVDLHAKLDLANEQFKAQCDALSERDDISERLAAAEQRATLAESRLVEADGLLARVNRNQWELSPKLRADVRAHLARTKETKT